MRISTDNDEVVQYIRTVKLDGKRILTAVTIDTDEGWVEIKVPRVDHAKNLQYGDHVDVENNDAGQFTFDWDTKRLFGKVEIEWFDDTPTHLKASQL